jgi:hypothetical protein
MSEAEAYLRIQAARLGRRFPLVVELLGQGALHLTAIKLLGPHLTLDNHAQLLERARGKRKREVELLVAEIAPKPDVPSRMSKLPNHASALRAAHSHFRHREFGTRLSHSVQGASSCNSHWDKRTMTNWNSSATCCATRCRTETWLASSRSR